MTLVRDAPLGESESEAEEQSAAGTPSLQQDQNCVSDSRGLWSSCCCSPYNLCTLLHHRNLQAGSEREKINV